MGNYNNLLRNKCIISMLLFMYKNNNKNFLKIIFYKFILSLFNILKFKKIINLNNYIALEADKTAMKGQVTVIADAIAALDKKAAAALVEKREMWSTISTIQSDITTSLARASYLEKEGFAVDPENVGALVKMHYKLHSYVTYKLKKGKK